MARLSPVSIFLAASSLIVATGSVQSSYAQDAGGLKEWNTDQGVEEKSTPDADASALEEKPNKRMFVCRLEKARIVGESRLIHDLFKPPPEVAFLLPTNRRRKKGSISDAPLRLLVRISC